MSPRSLPDARERLRVELSQATDTVAVKRIVAKTGRVHTLAWRVVARYAPVLDRALIEQMAIDTGIPRLGISPVETVVRHPLTRALVGGVSVRTPAFEQMLLDWPDAVAYANDVLSTSVPWEWAVLSFAQTGRLRAASPLGQRILELSSNEVPASMRLVYALTQAPDFTSGMLSKVCRNRYARDAGWKHVLEAPQADLEFISGRLGTSDFFDSGFLSVLAKSQAPWTSPGVSEYVLEYLGFSRLSDARVAQAAFVSHALEAFGEAISWPHPGVRLAALGWLENTTKDLPGWLARCVTSEDLAWLAVQPLSARARVRLVTDMAGGAGEDLARTASSENRQGPIGRAR